MLWVLNCLLISDIVLGSSTRFGFALGWRGLPSSRADPLYLHPKVITPRDNPSMPQPPAGITTRNDLFLFAVTIKEVAGAGSWQISPFPPISLSNASGIEFQIHISWGGWKMGLCLSQILLENRKASQLLQEHSTSTGCWGDKTKGVSSIWSVIMNSFGTAKVPPHKNAPEQTTREYSVHNSEQPRDGKENRHVLGSVFSYVQGIHSFPLCWSYEFVRVHVFPFIISHP